MARILIIRFSALGDVAMTVPVVHSLAAEYPQHEIIVLSRTALQPLFLKLPENVSFYGADLSGKHKGLRGLNSLYAELKGLHFDYVADFHDILRAKYLRWRFRLDGVPVAAICKGRAGKKKLVRRHHKVFEKQESSFRRYADVLEKLQYEAPIVGAVLEYRQYAKLKSTYAEGLLKAMDPDGRIRTRFQMTVTATGRLSSTEPNLQNIPTRTDLGSEIRRMFIPAEGCVLVDADYSQIELRLLAHISGDEAMRAAFTTGADIHTATAAQVFHVAPGDVTHEMRRRAKAVNFGIVYGISAFSLSQDIGVTVAEAKAYMEAYFATFPGVRKYMDDVVAKAKEQGYVETLFHRRRELPEIRSSNFNMRSFGERVALNMPIQGTAADIIKLAMIAVEKRLREGLPEARLVLQVHDELIVECPAAQAETAAALLEEEMENVVQLSVPLTAEAHWGRNWLEAKG